MANIKHGTGCTCRPCRMNHMTRQLEIRGAQAGAWWDLLPLPEFARVTETFYGILRNGMSTDDFTAMDMMGKQALCTPSHSGP